MTNNNFSMTSDAIAAGIKELRADLDKVNAAVSIIGKVAVEKAKEITLSIEHAQEQYASAMANEVLSARKARLSAYSDIVVNYPAGRDSLLKTPFTIKYTKIAYNGNLQTSVPREFSVIGFAALPDEAMEYLLEVKPSAIPAEIMALSPNDPAEALALYQRAKRRNCFR